MVETAGFRDFEDYAMLHYLTLNRALVVQRHKSWSAESGLVKLLSDPAERVRGRYRKYGLRRLNCAINANHYGCAFSW